MLQTAEISAGGTYTLDVGGVSESVGDYQIDGILNGAIESENYGGPANGAPGVHRTYPAVSSRYLATLIVVQCFGNWRAIPTRTGTGSA